jgi:Fe-S oxidoreductase
VGLERRFRWFREDLCNSCGECFVKCPVLNLPENAAKKDIQALIEGNADNSLAFQYCTTCNVCDQVCPRDADPYELILERYNDYIKKRGLPFLAKMIFPNEPENIWSSIRALMGKEEISLLSGWEENLHKPHKQILLTGFYTNLVPYLAKGKVLEELCPVIAGAEGLWGCGGDSNKLGAIDLTGQVIELLHRQFEQMGVERVYCFMEAEAAMLAEVLPKRFEAQFKFEALPLEYLILEKLQNGNIKVADKLNMKVTVHDNCMSRYFHGKPQEVVREIVSMTGCDIVEMEHSRLNSLCCGWAATIPTLYGERSGNPLSTLMHLLHSLYRRLQEGEATGADAMVTSCPACYIFLSLIKELTNSKMRICHPLEIVQMAEGEKYFNKTRQRSWEILAVATNLLLKWATSPENRKRFFPKPINVSEFQALPEPSRNDVRRVKWIAFFYNSVLMQNPFSKAFISLLTKTAIAAYRVGLRRRLRNALSEA